MRFEDRQALKNRLNLMTLQASKKEVAIDSDESHLPHRMQDSRYLNAQAGRLKNILDKDECLVARSDEDRSKLSRRMNEIRDHLIKSAPTYAEINVTMKSSGSAEFERVVQKIMHWNSPKILKLIEEWKQIKSRLEPDDPTADAVEMLSLTSTTVYMGGQPSASQ